jgi:hypothetical protein
VRLKAMIFLLGSAAAAAAVTALAAWLLVMHRPTLSATGQILRAAISFPIVAALFFVVATAVALTGAADAPPNQGAGMAVFAMVFFLFYAIAVGAVIGVPTAILTVKALRGP